MTGLIGGCDEQTAKPDLKIFGNIESSETAPGDHSIARKAVGLVNADSPDSSKAYTAPAATSRDSAWAITITALF
jgi:hypothetical protein